MLLQKQFLRYLRSIPKSNQFYARTTVNPIDFKLRPPPQFLAKSALIFATPNNLQQVIQDAITLHQENQLQIVVAGIDTMVPQSSRNGVSELWLENLMKIENPLLLEERDDVDKPPKESDGINPVSARKNWKNIHGSINLQLRPEVDLEMSLANTVFSTGSILTLFYFDPDQRALHSGEHLCEVDVKLPRGVVPLHSKLHYIDHWQPLYPGESFKITNCVGNLLKTIEKTPAAKYLENNDRLMSLKSKDTEVYVKIRDLKTSHVRRFKVTAGGGGWGAKADIIALSPEAKPKVGDRIEFFMVTPQDRFTVNDNHLQYENCMAFSTSYEQTSFQITNNGGERARERAKEGEGEGEENGKEKVFEFAFGCGSEQGFTLNDVRHISPGETAVIRL